MGYMHHSHYLPMLEMGRTELLRQSGPHRLGKRLDTLVFGKHLMPSHVPNVGMVGAMETDRDEIIPTVVGPDFVGADLRVARRSAGGGQHIQLIRRAAGQVHAARDQVLRLGALEAERVGAERVRQRAQFAVARVLVRFEHQVERATKRDLGLITFARGGGGGRLTGTGNRRQ